MGLGVGGTTVGPAVVVAVGLGPGSVGSGAAVVVGGAGGGTVAVAVAGGRGGWGTRVAGTVTGGGAVGTWPGTVRQGGIGPAGGSVVGSTTGGITGVGRGRELAVEVTGGAVLGLAGMVGVTAGEVAEGVLAVSGARCTTMSLQASPHAASLARSSVAPDSTADSSDASSPDTAAGSLRRSCRRAGSDHDVKSRTTTRWLGSRVESKARKSLASPDSTEAAAPRSASRTASTSGSGRPESVSVSPMCRRAWASSVRP
ncbi:hypothetical protein MM438_12755 [Arsenicicoccus dermatophilus]|nr:hypothetical protein [Arsenicicoccus dermatophilus]